MLDFRKVITKNILLILQKNIMKKMIFSAVALVAFSFAGMANEVKEKNKKILVKETIGDTYGFAGNKIDFKAQQAITWNGSIIDLSKKEVQLLKLLIENKNDVVTREKILQMVWGYNVYPTTRTIDNFILSFRKYFEADSRNPKHIHSVRGMGYKFTD